MLCRGAHLHARMPRVEQECKEYSPRHAYFEAEEQTGYGSAGNVKAISRTSAMQKNRNRAESNRNGSLIRKQESLVYCTITVNVWLSS